MISSEKEERAVDLQEITAPLIKAERVSRCGKDFRSLGSTLWNQPSHRLAEYPDVDTPGVRPSKGVMRSNFGQRQTELGQVKEQVIAACFVKSILVLLG